jgi:hypothetical protein
MLGSAFVSEEDLERLGLNNPDLGVNKSRLTGCDKTASSLVKAVNEIVTASIVRTITQCDQQTTLVQNVRVSCNPTVAEGDEVYEDNAACTLCLQSVRLDQEERDRLERARWQNDPNRAKVIQTKDAMYASVLRGMEICGLSVCKACVLLNATQRNIFDASMSCVQSSITASAITSNLENILRQQLESNRDVLSATLQDLGVESVESVVQNVATSISQNITSEFLSSLKQVVNSFQTIQIVSNSSIRANGFTQGSIITGVQSFVSSQSVALKSIGEARFQAIADIIARQNTLNDIGQVIFASTVTFARALDSSVGLIMFAVLGILGIIAIIVIVYLVYRFALKKKPATQIRR